MGQEIVIRDQSGTEHVFPPGFDPKRAAAIVNRTSAPPLAAPPAVSPAQQILQAQATRAPISDTPPPDAKPDGWGVFNRINTAALMPGSMDEWKQQLAAMLESGAHPKTVSDFASLILSGVDATRLAGQVPAAARGAKSLQGPVSTAAIKTGEAVMRGADAMQPHGFTAGTMDAFARGKVVEGIGIAATAPIVKILGRLIRAGGRYAAPATEAAAVEIPAAMRSTTTSWTPAAPSASRVPPMPGDPFSPPSAGPAAAPPAPPPSAGPAAPGAAAATVPPAASAPPVAPRMAPAAAAPLNDGVVLHQFKSLAQSLGVTLNAQEQVAGLELMRHGMAPEQAVEAIARIQQLPEAFRQLPTNAEVDATKHFPKMGQKTPRMGPPPKVRK